MVHANGTLTNLGTLPGFAHSQAHDVNDLGQVVGLLSNSPHGFASSDRAFVYSGGTMTQLPTFSGTSLTHAYSINNAGTIVGTSGTNRPFKFNVGDAALTGLTFPAGGAGAGKALNINTAGDIVGFEFTTFPAYRPIFWDNGVTPSALAMPAGATWAEATIINDAGVIAGSAWYSPGLRAYYYDANGTPVDMGTLGANDNFSEVFDINSSFQAVGVSRLNTLPFTLTPFYYANGAMVNLNSLLPPGSGWVLTRPISINDAGEIIGIGTFNGTPSVFRLTPIPEPAALAGVVVMTSVSLMRRRRCCRR